MKKYIVYFEIYGKKLKTEVNGKHEQDAKNMILEKIKFHKIVEINQVDNLKKIFNMN